MPLLRVIKPPRAVRGRKAGREEAGRERGEREAREGGREEGERSDGWDGAGQQPKGREGTCTHTHTYSDAAVPVRIVARDRALGGRAQGAWGWCREARS